MSERYFSAVSKLWNFDGYYPDIDIWIRKFELAAKLDEIPKEKLTEKVLIFLSDEVFKKVIDSGITEDSEYSEIKTFLLDNYSEKDNFFSLQSKFNTLVQNEHETVAKFGEDIFMTGKKAYGEAPDKLLNNILCHQFVKGLKSEEIRKNLLMSGDMNNLKRLISTASRMESSLSANFNEGNSSNVQNGDAQNQDELKTKFKNLEEKLDDLTNMIMSGGGGVGENKGEKNFQNSRSCFKCGKYGHLRRNCPRK